MSRITIFCSFLSIFFSSYLFGSTSSQLVGNWDCEPYVMKNEAYDVIVHDSPVYKANGQFLEVSKATVEYPNGFSFTFEVKLIGSWTFKNNIIDIKFEQSTFLSSNSPEITKQKGQKIADDQLIKKNWAKNEVTSLGEKLQFKAVDPIHKEANVLITCRKSLIS